MKFKAKFGFTPFCGLIGLLPTLVTIFGLLFLGLAATPALTIAAAAFIISLVFGFVLDIVQAFVSALS